MWPHLLWSALLVDTPLVLRLIISALLLLRAELGKSVVHSIAVRCCSQSLNLIHCVIFRVNLLYRVIIRLGWEGLRVLGKSFEPILFLLYKVQTIIVVLKVGVILLGPKVHFLERVITFRQRLALSHFTADSYQRVSFLSCCWMTSLREGSMLACRLADAEIFLFSIKVLRAILRSNLYLPSFGPLAIHLERTGSLRFLV